MNTPKKKQSENGQKPSLRPKQVSVSLETERQRVTEALFADEFIVFLDTNILIWSFSLNELASRAWQRWLESLGERLVIPAWVVHEYNQHTNQPEVTNPYKTLFRKLSIVLDELQDSCPRALNNDSTEALGCLDMLDLTHKLREASSFSLKVAAAVSKCDGSHRTELLKFYEKLLTQRTLPSNIHELALQVDQEFNTRIALRLSPGGEDSDKSQNRCDDLIIWKEILQHCTTAQKNRVLLLSNDVKRDWCYVPLKVVIKEGKEIPWSKESTQDLRLPNPELLAEFQMHTGGRDIVFATIEQIIEMLASTTLNTMEAIHFGELAQAIRSSRTPTDQAVDWIRRSGKHTKWVYEAQPFGMPPLPKLTLSLSRIGVGIR